MFYAKFLQMLDTAVRFTPATKNAMRISAPCAHSSPLGVTGVSVKISVWPLAIIDVAGFKLARWLLSS